MGKWKKVIGILFTVLILVSLIKKTEYIFRASNTDQCIAATDAFHNMPDNSFDVITYGSSHSWRGVNPMEMYEKYGIAAYNYSGNWQRLSTEALYFYDSLRTQSPKVVLFETYKINEVIEDEDLDGEIYYTRHISDFPYKRHYLHKAFGNSLERYIAYYFPLSQFHSSWNDINVDNFKEWFTVEEYENTMGYCSVIKGDSGKETTEVRILDPDTFEQYELCPEAIEILDGIVKTCKENDIAIIFYTNPCQGEYNYSDAMTRYAEENDCVYLDLFKLFDDVGFDETTDFSDEGHLNRLGAIKAADFLGAYINDTYDLKDMRNVEGNLWEGKLNNIVGNKLIEWKETHPEYQ